MFFLFLVFIFTSCNMSSEKTEFQLFLSNTISIPVLDMVLINNLQNENLRPTSESVLVKYVSEDRCTSCTLSQIASVEKKYQDVFSDKRQSFVYVVSVSPDNCEKVKKDIDSKHLLGIVYIDTCNAFLHANPHIPDNELFHTFVINSEGKVLMVGSPFLNEKMEALFKKVIANERKKHKIKKSA